VRFKRSLILAVAVLSPLLVGASFSHFVDQARTTVTAAASPFLEFQDQITRWVQTGIQAVFEWPVLRQKNEALETDLKSLHRELIGLEELKQEKARLEALLNLKTSSYQRAAAARVIARDPSHWSQFIVIDKGSVDGIREDAVLVHPDGLIGKVVSSGRYSARAILLTDPESRVSALNQRTRDVGLIKGTGAFTLKMTYLDRESKVQVGDLIVSSGLGGIYPKGIPIGRVELVGEDRSQLALYAVVKPFVSFSKLEDLLCISSQTTG
jgi:rod shape-determining protein MreC